MRLYYLIRDTSAVKQSRDERERSAANLALQPFGAAVAGRQSRPNEQLDALKINPSGEYRLGGIDLDDPTLLALLDAESRKIDARFSQVPRRLELVLLAELRRALPAEEAARSANLSVLVVAFGERSTAIAGVQAYLRANAADWY